MLLLSRSLKTSCIAVALIQCFSVLSFATISASLSAQTSHCQTHISVGASVDSSNCDPENFTSNQTLFVTDIQCGNLQEALLLIARGSHQLDCVLMVMIQEGHYSISQEIEISQNLMLNAASTHDVSVSFTVNNSSLRNQSYPLLFIHTEFVELVGIEFHGSSGIIGFENVTDVVITDSIFR